MVQARSLPGLSAHDGGLSCWPVPGRVHRLFRLIHAVGATGTMCSSQTPDRFAAGPHLN